jgi:hypothetical protein
MKKTLFGHYFADEFREEPSLDDTLIEAMMAETLASVPDYSSLADASRARRETEAPDNRKTPAEALADLQKLLQTVENRWSQLLMQFLREPTRVRFAQHAVLPFEQLELLAPERSYFTLLQVNGLDSVWLLHCSREIAEGMASIRYQERQQSQRRKVSPPRLSEADSLVYVEIGGFLRQCAQEWIHCWRGHNRLSLSGFRHQLNLGKARNFPGQEAYLVLHFTLENRLFQGEGHLALPLQVAEVLLDR